MLQVPPGVFSAAFLAHVLEGGLLASAVTVVEKVGCRTGCRLNCQTCDLVVHPIAHVWVIDSTNGAISVIAPIDFVITEGHFCVPTAYKALSIVIEVPNILFDLISPVAERLLCAAVVFVLEEIAAVIIGSWYGAEHEVFRVLLVKVEAFTLLAEIFSEDDLLVHELSQLVCLLLFKLCHDVK